MGMAYSTVSRMVRVKFPKLETPYGMSAGKLDNLIDGAMIYMTKKDDLYKSNLLRGIASVMLTNQVVSGDAWKDIMYILTNSFDNLVKLRIVWYTPYEPLRIVTAKDVDVSQIKDPMFTKWVDREAENMQKSASKDALDNLAMAIRHTEPSYTQWLGTPQGDTTWTTTGRFSSKEPNISELSKEAPFEECQDCNGEGKTRCEGDCRHGANRICNGDEEGICEDGYIICQTCGGTGIKAKEQFKIKARKRRRVEFGEEGKGVVNTNRSKHVIIKSEE